MGFSNAPTSYLDPALEQTPVNVKTVRVNAGLTLEEAAELVDVTEYLFIRVEDGQAKFSSFVWSQFLEKAGQRAFDYDPE